MACYDPVVRYSLVVRAGHRILRALDSPWGAAGPRAGADVVHRTGGKGGFSPLKPNWHPSRLGTIAAWQWVT